MRYQTYHPTLVEAIIRRLGEKQSHAQIAKHFGVSACVITKIAKGKSELVEVIDGRIVARTVGAGGRRRPTCRRCGTEDCPGGYRYETGAGRCKSIGAAERGTGVGERDASGEVGVPGKELNHSRRTLRAIWISKPLLDRVTVLADGDGSSTRAVFERLVAIGMAVQDAPPLAQEILNDVAKERAHDAVHSRIR